MSLFDVERFYRPLQRPLFDPTPGIDPGAVNGAEGPSCACSGPPHTPSCRLHRWAERHVKACGPRAEPQGPEIRRQAKASLAILGRLQAGPATGLQLATSGGGLRFGARILELRQAGHNIEAIHKGSGVWEYRLILL